MEKPNLIDMRKNQNEIKALQDIIKDSCADNWTMLEIGSYRGQSAEIFMNTGKIKTLYCVDPWKNGYDENDAASFSNMAAVEDDFDTRIAVFNGCVIKCKGTLSDFIRQFNNVKIDIAYVDGCHQYEGCRDDLIMLKSILKPTVIAGHDYGNGWAGVQRAVSEIVGTPDRRYDDSSWLKYMKY